MASIARCKHCSHEPWQHFGPYTKKEGQRCKGACDCPGYEPLFS